MPKLCAFGCKQDDGVPVHRFPNHLKFPERFKEWVMLCGGKLDTESDYECYKKKLVCDRYFTNNDHNRYKRLNVLAVPSLFLSGTPACENLTSANVAEMTDRPSEIPLHQPYNMAEAGTPACVNLSSSNVAEIADTSILHLQPSMTETPAYENLHSSNVAEKADRPIQASLHQPSVTETPACENVHSSNVAEKADRPIQASLHQPSVTETPACENVHSSNVAEKADRPIQASLHQPSVTETPACVKLRSSNVAEKADRPIQDSLPQPSVTGRTSDKNEDADYAQVLDEHNYTAASRCKRLTAIKSPWPTPKFNCIQVSKMRTQIKWLRSEICRLRKRTDFKKRLLNAQKLSENMAFKQVVGRMAKPSQLFINMQMQAEKKSKGRRFTIEEKILCLSLFKKSPKCYALLHKYFTLPSAKAMKRLLGRIKLSPGINPIIFEKIKQSVAEKDTTDKLCSLAFDEMSITAQVHYNEQKDTIEGFASNNDCKFADHALVFMVKGIKQNFKQPLAYYFTNCLNKTELKKLIKTVIRHAQDSGLIIINTVCDQSTVNVSVINELVEDEKAAHLRLGREWRYDRFSVNGRQIIPLFDTPHLIKGIRNNLITKDLIYTTKNIEKTVKWEYYQKVYNADKSHGELKLLHKITEEHIIPEKINKMRVKTATQLFSHSVAVVTEHLTARGDLPDECRQLIDITLLLNNLFDSLNVSTFHVPDGKIYKGAVKKNSPHHELWKESKQILKSAKFVCRKFSGGKIRLIETTVPSITNLIKTINGMEAIWQVLTNKFGLNAMLTRNFNQENFFGNIRSYGVRNVENFFGNIRSYGVRNIAPNTIAFEGAFKALLVNNYSTPHSKKANCEEDGGECLQNLDFFLREKYNQSNTKAASDIAEENIINENLCVLQHQEDDAGQRNYVCGWVITKCLKKVCKSCQQCRQDLLNTNKNHSYLRAKEYCNKNWLCYPSEDANNCFQEIQNIITTLLKQNAPKKNVKQTFIMYCNLLVDWTFKCLTHKEQLKECFTKHTINVIVYSWCKSINQILSGKITYDGNDEIKTSAAIYYNKHKHYKNRK